MARSGKSQLTEEKLKEAKATRRRLALSVRGALDALRHEPFPKRRRSELDHEEELLLVAYQVLTKPSIPTFEEEKAEEERQLLESDDDDFRSGRP